MNKHEINVCLYYEKTSRGSIRNTRLVVDYSDPTLTPPVALWFIQNEMDRAKFLEMIRRPEDEEVPADDA